VFAIPLSLLHLTKNKSNYRKPYHWLWKAREGGTLWWKIC